MQLATGKVVDGKVVLAGTTLPEGTVVAVLSQVPESGVRLPAHLLAELDAALEEADREEGISLQELLAQLKPYG